VGLAITKTDFTPADYTEFTKRLLDNLTTLETVLKEPSFGGDTRSMGAEVELYIMDKKGKPFAINQRLQSATDNEQITLELNQYNIEFNFKPTDCDGTPFSRLEQQWTETYSALNTCAEKLEARVSTIGILPTLSRPDLGPTAITPSARYLALSEQLREQRHHSPFNIKLNGPDPLHFCCEDVSPEGANASFQFHYRTPAGTWEDTFNAAQLITPLVLALSGNSPFFLGHRLWHETRIGLFKQAVDSRDTVQQLNHLPARVSLGQGWVRQSIQELFAESVALYPPLLPICSTQDDGDITITPLTPALQELRLHHGCIWPWNRVIYDPTAEGHIRVELRTLPSGPTAIDMLANAALSVGLIEGLRPYLSSLLSSLPFNLVEKNFYRAAQLGLWSTLIWPDYGAQPRLAQPAPITACNLLKKLIPIADSGLASIGIDAKERTKYLDVISNRSDSGQTGSIWQLKRYAQLLKDHPKENALMMLVEDYHAYSCQNIPVHLWPI